MLGKISFISIAFFSYASMSFAQTKKVPFKGGKFKYLECDQIVKGQSGDGSSIATQASVNLIVDKDKKIKGIEGIISTQTTTSGRDFVHGFSTLTGKVTGVEGDDSAGTVFTIANGKEVINADGDIQKGGAFTALSFGGRGDNPAGKDSAGNAAVFQIGGKTTIVKNCVASNTSLIAI